MAGKTVVEAYAHADRAHNKIDAHEDLCAERYRNINTSLTALHSTVRGARSAGAAVALAVIGWLLIQVYEKLDPSNSPPPPPASVSSAR